MKFVAAAAALGLAGAGLTVAPRGVEHAGLLGLPTELSGEREAAMAGLASAERDYHRALVDYSARVRERRLGAVQRDLEAQGYRCVPARVIDVEMTEERQRIHVDRGHGQGVSPGAVAVVFRGLVGLVIEARLNVSEVVLLTDPHAGVPVSAWPPGSRTTEPEADKAEDDEGAEEGDEEEGEDPAGSESETAPQPARGAALGGCGPGLLLLTYLDGPVAPGSEVVTSGEGTLYPADLRVGEVVGHPISDERDQPAKALVGTWVDWAAVREVVLAIPPASSSETKEASR